MAEITTVINFVVCTSFTFYASSAMFSFFISPYLSGEHGSDPASLNNLGMSIFTSSDLASLPACGTSHFTRITVWVIFSAISGAP